MYHTVCIIMLPLIEPLLTVSQTALNMLSRHPEAGCYKETLPCHSDWARHDRPSCEEFVQLGAYEVDRNAVTPELRRGRHGHEEETGPISLGSFPESAGSFQLFLLAPQSNLAVATLYSVRTPPTLKAKHIDRAGHSLVLSSRLCRIHELPVVQDAPLGTDWATPSIPSVSGPPPGTQEAIEAVERSRSLPVSSCKAKSSRDSTSKRSSAFGAARCEPQI